MNLHEAMGISRSVARTGKLPLAVPGMAHETRLWCAQCVMACIKAQQCSHETGMTWQLSFGHRLTLAVRIGTGILSSSSVWGSDSSFTRCVAACVSERPVVCPVGSMVRHFCQLRCTEERAVVLHHSDASDPSHPGSREGLVESTVKVRRRANFARMPSVICWTPRSGRHRHHRFHDSAYR